MPISAGQAIRPFAARLRVCKRSSERYSRVPGLAACVCLLSVLAGFPPTSQGQNPSSPPRSLDSRRLPADVPPADHGLPIHTLPSAGSESFTFAAPRDYQAVPAVAVPGQLDPSMGMSPDGVPLESPGPMQGVNWDDATAVDLDSKGGESPVECSPFGEFFYRGAGYLPQDGWLVGNGDRLGMYDFVIFDDTEASLGWLNYRFGAAVHFISGPVQTDLPPRVYDITFGFPRRGTLGDRLSYDLLTRVGWYSDFEGGAADGIRFPSHALLYYRVNESWQWLLGIDYLDRDDVSLLPVGGVLWTPSEDWRIEAVFPKPMIAYRFRGYRWVYVASEMGGDTWDIERATGADDIFTYRDFRILFGLQANSGEEPHCLEIGYVFGRHLEYRSGTPDYSPPDTILIRSVKRY